MPVACCLLPVACSLKLRNLYLSRPENCYQNILKCENPRALAGVRSYRNQRVAFIGDWLCRCMFKTL
ncbi:MAG: hypothetical protein F6J90_10910 [Moorea sp. SIOASIH]|nr:hypothetical protein [Moorena sp. SIOASIH]